MYLEKRKFWGDWDIEWEVALDQLVGVPGLEDNKLIVSVKKVENLSFLIELFKFRMLRNVLLVLAINYIPRRIWLCDYVHCLCRKHPCKRDNSKSYV